MPLFRRSIDLCLKTTSSFRKEDSKTSFFLRINRLIYHLLQSIPHIQNRMTQKYYHNDYKKLLGVDQTRTASEKLLDRAIGRPRPAPETPESKPAEKKVKQEPSNLTHSEVLAKIVKNIVSNSNAAKLLKPLNVLKKCLEDKSFIVNPQVNKLEQWLQLLHQLLGIDLRLIGNYGETLPVYQSLLQIFSLLSSILNSYMSLEGKQYSETIKEQQDVNQVKLEEKLVPKLELELPRCELQIMYYKMFTDDSFTFNKTLLQFKKKYFSIYQSLSQAQPQQKNELFENYLAELLLKLFRLPHKKYEWIKSSLSQFFKQFNINYKQLIQGDLLGQYLQAYNGFINQKGGHPGGEDVNIFGGGFKAGTITSVEVVKNDGFDTWASKQ